MSNVWKIGSRWSDYGSWDSRIITIFRRSNVVFVGGDASERFRNQVNKGDYFAIADGYTVVAVARSTSEVMPLPSMISNGIIKVREGEPFDISRDYDGCFGAKVKIVDLPPQDQFIYPKRGTFFSANMFWTRIKDLYDSKVNKSFNIDAKTYRFGPSENKDSDGYEKHSILNGKTQKTTYIIPVYQREYSWGYEQVSRFIRDLFRGFWGTEEKKVLIREPMFIGTMQLSFKKYISSKEYEQDIIDGQQRLSTFLCLIKYLKFKYPENNRTRDLSTDWLETRVNNGKEDKYLCEMCALGSIDEARKAFAVKPNKYIENLLIIDESFSQLITDEKGNVIPFFEDNIDNFLDYLLEKVFMVVVETVAGLSKTIQIFNTINTTGLELDGNDLFKVRLYEYLKDMQDADESVFNEIGEIYRQVKVTNEQWRQAHNFDIVSMHGVRSVYKDYLIARYKLPNALYQMSTDTFFDYLFDVLLNIQEHDEIKNTNGLILSLEDIKNIINACVIWKSHSFETEEELIDNLLIKKSRYGRYSSYAYQIMLATKELGDDLRISAVNSIFNRLCRVFFCYSTMYAKQINEVHSFMNKAYNLIISNGIDATLEHIENKLSIIDRSSVKKSIGGEIAYNRIWKDLICCLSAFFDEIGTEISLNDLERKLSRDYDIEHIHATADENIEMPEQLQNSIGNLMLLEYDINRSIGCEQFDKKVRGINGHKSYADSNYETVKKISKHPKWDEKEATERKDQEIIKIMDFLFKN